jgi:outer membrane biosynthesis protein TonB
MADGKKPGIAIMIGIGKPKEGSKAEEDSESPAEEAAEQKKNPKLKKKVAKLTSKDKQSAVERRLTKKFGPGSPSMKSQAGSGPNQASTMNNSGNASGGWPGM